jgi:outer membrane lipoprotein-sorting protein
MLSKPLQILFSCFILITGLFIFSSFYLNNHNTDADAIVNKMFAAMQNVKTLQYKLRVTERIRGKIEARESQVKLQISPRKLYMKIKNQEVLWVQGTNGGNALINPGTFPYVNLNLDPLGSIMRKDQHHTIHELGFAYIASILKNHLDKHTSDFKKHFFITGEEVFDGKTCYKLSVLMPDFGWETYTVKKGENIVTIARKLHISEYMILENNPNISWYDAVKEDQQIQVPNSYSKYALLLVDKETMLPVSTKLIDDKGLFEAYYYTDLKINAHIPPEEFTRGYKDYNF